MPAEPHSGAVPRTSARKLPDGFWKVPAGRQAVAGGSREGRQAVAGGSRAGRQAVAGGSRAGRQAVAGGSRAGRCRALGTDGLRHLGRQAVAGQWARRQAVAGRCHNDLHAGRQ